MSPIKPGFGIGSHALVVESAVIPVTGRGELVEPERRLGERGEHRSVTGRVIHDEGLSVSPPLELVLLAPADQLRSIGVERKEQSHVPGGIGPREWSKSSGKNVRSPFTCIVYDGTVCIMGNAAPPPNCAPERAVRCVPKRRKRQTRR